MDLSSFRRHAHELVDWMANYLESIESRPVVPDVEPGEIRKSCPEAPPTEGESFETIFEDFTRTVVPGMTHWQHPGWFAYFPANSSPPSVLAEMLTATLAAQGMSWQTSPAATELEEVVMKWVSKLLGLPDGFTGVIQDTASTATLVALLSARERVTGHGFGQSGRADQPLVVYASREAHASVAKAAKLAGYGLEHFRMVATTPDRALDPGALREAIAEDRSQGRLPTCVVATVGTTSSGAVDPLPAIGALCQEENLWLHVDAAWAGSAAICPEFRSMLDGIETADSFLFNPHKWLLTNFDCTAYYVRDVDTLLRAFATDPEYLKTHVDSEVVNYRDWQIQLGRRFRALKLWFVIRSYGASGLQEMIRRHVALAEEFAGWVDADPDFELMAPRSLALVCFRAHPAAATESDLDELNQRLLDTVNSGREIHLTHTRLDGSLVIRLAIGQLYTDREHVDRAWKLIREALPRS